MEAAELAGTVVFAVSGVIAVVGHRLDWFGAIVVGIVTAIGGSSSASPPSPGCRRSATSSRRSVAP